MATWMALLSAAEMPVVTPAGRGIDGDREGGAVGLGVLLFHLLRPILAAFGISARHPVAGDQRVDRLGRDQLRREDQVALVLLEFVIATMTGLPF
ncbi:MAG: hypothetical protein U0133_04415 [Gemmatimonadales bacterium]